MSDGVRNDLDEVRRMLAAREEGCWHRLEDALSELVAVHGAQDEEIVPRLLELLAQERAAAPLRS